MPVDPRTRALLDMLNRIEAPRLHDQPLDIARHNFHKLLYAYRGEVQAVESVSDLVIPRRELEGGPVLGRLYRPLHPASEALPVLLWMHGGGWTLGDIAGYDALCRQLANAAGCAVLSLDYRLAPENPFPAAVEDAWLALRWLAREARQLGLDDTRIAVGGDSAGGNLTAVICHIARDAGAPAVRLQLMVYPSTDLTSEHGSHAEYGEGYFLDEASIAWFLRNYLPAEADRLDWRASPLLAPRFDGLPPACIITAECDPTIDDARAYADRLLAAGVPVHYREYAGTIHGFFTMTKLLPAAGEAIAEAADALREAFRD